MKIGFLGFGLIGGSIARSLKKASQKHAPLTFGTTHPEKIIIQVYTRRQNEELEKGVAEGVIDHIVYELDGNFCDCDIILLCAPVLTNISFLKQLKGQIKPSCIITDVGSVKGNIHKEVESLGMEHCFIGGHPMAGSEKTGYENSTTTLLENAYYLLTVTPQTKPGNLQIMKDLVNAVGSICVILSPSDHDNITAAISHVPHVIATTLVNLVRLHDTDISGETDAYSMKEFAAGGFKDITRIASSSPEMWQNIVLSNAESIRFFLQEYIALLENFSEMIENEQSEQLQLTFRQASDYRDAVPSNGRSILTKYYEIFVDVADETGAIATIATLLASHAISIKNIGIIHNREFADGVLRIEFYNENTNQEAEKLLVSSGYKICQR